MRKWIVVAFVLGLGTALVFAAAIRLDVREHVLANGMKILMLVKGDAPRVVCHVYYKVGSINERPGITGVAHIHEHMMFKGTRMMGVKDFDKDRELDQKIDALMERIYREKYWQRNGGDKEKIAQWQKEADDLINNEKALIIKDDLWETYMRNGGTGLNASTSDEVTGYYVTLPSNKVELQMLLESDRMRNAYFREFYSEKDVVMEERRLSENRPNYLFDEQVRATFFAASPYHWDVIGWMDDLKRMTKQDLQNFHDRYYVPNNAVAVYVGDIQPEQIIRLAETYFGSIPQGPDNEPIRTAEPPQFSEKRLYGEGPAAANISMLFHMPADGHPDTYPLIILGQILSGETGRLYKSLIKEKDLATRVAASTNPQWYVGTFEINAFPKSAKGVSPEQLESELWSEIDKVKKDGVTAPELEKAKNKLQARLIMSLQMPMAIASRLGRAELNRGWRSLLTDLEQLQKVNAAEVQAAANRYLLRDNATIAIYKRKMGK